MDTQSFSRLGSWLRRKYQDSQQKNKDARKALQNLGVDESDFDSIRKDWDSARTYHTKQIPSNVLTHFVDNVILILCNVDD